MPGEGPIEKEAHLRRERHHKEQLRKALPVVDTEAPLCYILRKKQLHKQKLQEKLRKIQQEVKMMKKIEFVNMDGVEVEMHLSLRSRCFLVVQEFAGPVLGRIVVELNGAEAPMTALNFLSLCRGDSGHSYKDSPFHFVLPSIVCSAGDVTMFDGLGGTSIYGRHFYDEENGLKHDGPGILSTDCCGRNTNDSKFNITFKAAPALDGKCVVFGRVTSGLKVLEKIEDYGSKCGLPRTEVIISNCGEIL